MGRPTDFLTNTRRIIKLYESMLRSICEKHRLTLLEATILSFSTTIPGSTPRLTSRSCGCCPRATYPRRWKA